MEMITVREFNSKNLSRARSLRKDMTPWERKLWYLFLKTYPVKFRRQVPVDAYIADFLCIRVNLVLELDGGGHYTPEQAEKDAERTSRLNELGFRVFRICNTDIDHNFRGVCEKIDMMVHEILAVV